MVDVARLGVEPPVFDGGQAIEVIGGTAADIEDPLAGTRRQQVDAEIAQPVGAEGALDEHVRVNVAENPLAQPQGLHRPRAAPIAIRTACR
ncbi:MAG: hypothetical protein HY216_05335 [Candidatus Rokubacteria bacterium]|nr:hypothetical protein [Candidatus Rokubacteria bacterium]